VSGVTRSRVGLDFATTHWSDIVAARTASPGRQQAVLDNLARRYWKSVYCYLRARGLQDADARDTTQDFFVEIVLGRDLFGQAEQHRGRFRAYLLHSLKNFVRDRHRRAHARRRAPDGLILEIDAWADRESSRYLPPPLGESPEDLFHRKWAASLLEQVLERLRDACRKAGLDVHLEIFQQRVVRPALDQASPASTEALADRYGLTCKQVANRVETIRRRFRRLLMDEVRLTVTDEEAAEEEIRCLMTYLTAAGP
jgi:RNA polymerase sigma factor (sigma-70 family)